jgi:chromosome segregation ATPase
MNSLENATIKIQELETTNTKLCDKHSSLEEECKALMSAKTLASSYLSQLDHLCQANSSLKSSTSKAEKKIERLTHVEGELTRKLKDAKQENLQLMLELNIAKNKFNAKNHSDQLAGCHVICW